MALFLFVALLVALSISGYWYLEATKRADEVDQTARSGLLAQTDQRLSDTKNRMAGSRRQLQSAAQDIDNTYQDAKRRMETRAADFDRYERKGE